jgi:TPR repeat protein
MKINNGTYAAQQTSKPVYHLLGLLAVSLTLCSCEVPILLKDKGEFLREGDAAALEEGNLDKAQAAYHQALQSSHPDIRAQAAYDLAAIAKHQNKNQAARKYIEEAAESGHPSAKLELIDLYKKDGAPKRQAMKTLSLSIADTSPAANIALLETASRNNETEAAASYAVKAEELLLSQISAGDIDGGKSLMLARLYSQHGTLFTSPRDAEPLYRSAISKGNIKAVSELAEIWIKAKPQTHSAEDIFALMIQGAQAGDDTAIKYVADAYQNGNGVKQNTAEAIRWFEKVQGRMNVKTLLVLAYGALGQSPETAKAYFGKAAAQGSLEAEMMLAGLASGEHTINAKKFKIATPDSMVSAIKKIEESYGKNRADMIEKMYRAAARAGSGKAALYMAQNSDEGQSTGWYEKAANLGSPQAMLFMGRQAKIETGQENSQKVAFSWFEKAAKAGSPEGQYETGIAYARGSGVEKNLEKARYWLEKAKTGGYLLAMDVLKTIRTENTEDKGGTAP